MSSAVVWCPVGGPVDLAVDSAVVATPGNLLQDLNSVVLVVLVGLAAPVGSEEDSADAAAVTSVVAFAAASAAMTEEALEEEAEVVLATKTAAAMVAGLVALTRDLLRPMLPVDQAGDREAMAVETEAEVGMKTDVMGSEAVVAAVIEEVVATVATAASLAVTENQSEAETEDTRIESTLR